MWSQIVTLGRLAAQGHGDAYGAEVPGAQR
jgi:hypothetical protein